MKKILIAASLIAASAASASAADLAARPYTKAPPMMAAIYDWSGFYIGANGGWGSSRDRRTFDTLTANLGSYDATGGVAGGQIGYRWQAGTWVFGLEAQGDWADLRGRTANLFVPDNTIRSKMDAFGLFTGQVGYAWSNVLWYVKGGAAVANDKYQGITNLTGLAFDRVNQTRWGGVVGTGLEFGFAPSWSVAVEYDHIFMGSGSVSFLSTPAQLFDRTDSIKQNVDMGTVRVNYRWGGPVIAKY